MAIDPHGGSRAKFLNDSKRLFPVAGSEQAHGATATAPPSRPPTKELVKKEETDRRAREDCQTQRGSGASGHINCGQLN